jgi:hypothetical protein
VNFNKNVEIENITDIDYIKFGRNSKAIEAGNFALKHNSRRLQIPYFYELYTLFKEDRDYYFCKIKNDNDEIIDEYLIDAIEYKDEKFDIRLKSLSLLFERYYTAKLKYENTSIQSIVKDLFERVDFTDYRIDIDDIIDSADNYVLSYLVIPEEIFRLNLIATNNKKYIYGTSNLFPNTGSFYETEENSFERGQLLSTSYVAYINSYGNHPSRAITLPGSTIYEHQLSYDLDELFYLYGNNADDLPFVGYYLRLHHEDGTLLNGNNVFSHRVRGYALLMNPTDSNFDCYLLANKHQESSGGNVHLKLHLIHFKNKNATSIDYYESLPLFTTVRAISGDIELSSFNYIERTNKYFLVIKEQYYDVSIKFRYKHYLIEYSETTKPEITSTEILLSNEKYFGLKLIDGFLLLFTR